MNNQNKIDLSKIICVLLTLNFSIPSIVFYVVVFFLIVFLPIVYVLIGIGLEQYRIYYIFGLVGSVFAMILALNKANGKGDIRNWIAGDFYFYLAHASIFCGTVLIFGTFIIPLFNEIILGNNISGDAENLFKYAFIAAPIGLMLWSIGILFLIGSGMIKEKITLLIK